MSKWENPYSELQHDLRSALTAALHRTNGCVSRDQFMACATLGREPQAERLLSRLLLARTDGTWEWKEEFADEETVRRRVGDNPSVSLSDLLVLWRLSRQPSLRTSFPHIAPSNWRSQLVSRHNWRRESVFGVDVLVRPPTEFHDESAASLNRNLQVGDESICLVVHGTFDRRHLVDDGSYLVRLVVGNDLAISRIASQIPRLAGTCEIKMRPCLLAGDPAAAVMVVLPHLNTFAHESALALLQ